MAMIRGLRPLGMALAVMAFTSSPAHAQETGDEAVRTAFTGAYAGPEIGAHEHHFYVEETNIQTRETRGRYYRAWGVGGGAFAGYDLPVSPRVRIGLEASVSLGGKGPVARFADGTFLARYPQWGLRGTGRVGYVLNSRLLAYGTFGYGGHRYRIENPARVTDVNNWGSSFTIGAGVEYRISPRVGLRLDFRHLDNSMSHILVGVPVRF